MIWTSSFIFLSLVFIAKWIQSIDKCQSIKMVEENFRPIELVILKSFVPWPSSHIGCMKVLHDIDEYKIAVGVYVFHQDYKSQKLQIRVWSEIYIYCRLNWSFMYYFCKYLVVNKMSEIYERNRVFRMWVKTLMLPVLSLGPDPGCKWFILLMQICFVISVTFTFGKILDPHLQAQRTAFTLRATTAWRFICSLIN